MKKILGAALTMMVLAGSVYLGGVTVKQPAPLDDGSQTGSISRLSGNNNWPL